MLTYKYNIAQFMLFHKTVMLRLQLELMQMY